MTRQTSTAPILLLAALFISQSAGAQVSIGIRGGLLLTNVDKSPLEQGEPRPEIQFAIPVEIAFGKVFAVQPEFMVGSHGVQQRATDTETVLGITTTTRHSVKYQVGAVEIPLLAKLKFGSEKLSLQVFAGPSLGFGTSGKLLDQWSVHSTLADGTVVLDKTTQTQYKAKFVPEGYAAGEVSDTEFAVSPVILNAHLGAGLGLDLGGPAIFLDTRFTLGLNDLRPESESDKKDLVYKSYRIGASVGVMFPL